MPFAPLRAIRGVISDSNRRFLIVVIAATVTTLMVVLTHPLSATAEATRTISGTVSVPDGVPSAAFAAVTVIAVGGGTESYADVGSDGRYTLQELKPGQYTIRFSVGTYADGDRDVRPNLIEKWYGNAYLSAGAASVDVRNAPATGIDVALSTGATLSLSVAGLSGDDAYVSLQSTSGEALTSAAVDPDTGTAELVGIPAGSWYLGLDLFGSGDNPSFQFLGETGGSRTWTFADQQQRTAAAAARTASASFTGVVTAYGFSNYDTPSIVGDVYGYENVDGAWVQLPDLKQADLLFLVGNGQFRYTFGPLVPGTYAAGFGPPRFQFEGDTDPSTVDGPITQQWWPGASNVGAATSFELSTDTVKTGIDGTIRPARFVDSPTGFVDVASDKSVTTYSPFAAEITWMKTQGISTGYQLVDGKALYQPLGKVSREAMAAFVYRASGSPEFTPPTVSPFADVSNDPDSDNFSQFYKEITWLAERQISTGWVVGGKRLYHPRKAISREAMAAFIYRARNSPSYRPPSKSPFADVNQRSTEFYKEITWMQANKISTGWVNGSTATYRPRSAITRDAMAAFIKRAVAG